MIKQDWHLTQNTEYLNLLSERIKNPIKLLWVDQFSGIINEFIKKNNIKNLEINDIGCNVGHFCKSLNELTADVSYRGYDISETYLSIAKENFPDQKFKQLDVSHEIPEQADVTIISATLEHINNHQSAIENILSSTRQLCLIRTFLGEKYIEDECLSMGAEKPYAIKQFTLECFKKIITNNQWSIEPTKDKATNGIAKSVCNGKTITRAQNVLIFRRNQ
jgi:SAM-dependent methyltransferase